MRAQTSSWTPVLGDNQDLNTGDRVRTERDARAMLNLKDGSRIELGPSSVFLVDFVDGQEQFRFKLNFGRLKAWIKRTTSKRLAVLTPTSVCAVRGTEFAMFVDPDTGDTTAELYEGSLSVADNKGNETLLDPNERINVTEEGLGPKTTIEEGRQQDEEGEDAQAKDGVKKEVGLFMSKEQVQAAAAEEIKLAEYQQGKAVIDVFGNRVRLEQYIMRPRSDQFKLVVLNDREDRFDYFFYLGTFNTMLPDDLSVALRQLTGGLTAPSYYLTDYETGRSNLTDTIQETASGGHLVDVNNNTPADDDISLALNPVTDAVEAVTAGQSFWKTLFNDYGIKYNGQTMMSWTGSNIQSMDDATFTYAGGSYNVESSYPSDGMFHNRIQEEFGNGVTTQWDNYIISDEGEVAKVADFGGIAPGAQYKATLLKWNFEQVVTSSLFGGRKIDLVVEPKTLVQSGVIP
ncbi:MAG: FecR family protein [Elusimicrobiota bacterium]